MAGGVPGQLLQDPGRGVALSGTHKHISGHVVWVRFRFRFRFRIGFTRGKPAFSHLWLSAARMTYHTPLVVWVCCLLFCVSEDVRLGFWNVCCIACLLCALSS